MNAGLDADQPTPAMTPDQLKEDAVMLRRAASNYRAAAAQEPDTSLAAKHRRMADQHERLADLLDSLREETKTWTGDMDTHVFTRFVSEWTDQPTTEEAHRG